jgi:transposase-like protein
MQSQDIVLRKRRPTTEERLQMVERYHRSGLTRQSFCQQEGIPVATLGYWLTRIKRRSNPSNEPEPIVFSEVRLTSAMASATDGWAMEVVSPEGVTIRYREAFSVNELIGLLRGHQC